MTRDELEALLAGHRQPEPDIALVIEIGRVARARADVRALAEEVAAADPFIDDVSPDLLDPPSDGLRLAAASEDGTLPARYLGAGVQILLCLDVSGRLVARLEVGEGEHTLEIAEQQFPLILAQDVLIPDLGGPPSDLTLRDGSGGRASLKRRA